MTLNDTAPCPACGEDALRPGTITFNLGREGETVRVENVPARICDACGDASLSAEVQTRLLTLGELIARGALNASVIDFSTGEASRA